MADSSKKTSQAGSVILWITIFLAVASMPESKALPYVGPIFAYLSSVGVVAVGAYAKYGLSAARDNDVSDQEAGARPPVPGVDPTPADAILNRKPGA